MNINYNHQANLHTQEGAWAALSTFFYSWKPTSLLDIGCGTGTWLNAALKLGISDVLGVDGILSSKDELLIPSVFFLQHDLTQSLNLRRRFDAALCLEVAEHLEEHFAEILISSLTNHTDTVIFSAACPGQGGQNHVNCQWPAYWQNLFNQVGFVCSDELRWQIWDNSQVEVWYRQNIFIARRDPSAAGQEERIKPIVHPDFLPFIRRDLAEQLVVTAQLERVDQIEKGSMPITWYLTAPLKALYAKTQRRAFAVHHD